MEINAKIIGVRRILAVLLAMFAVTGSAGGDTIRCGTKIVKIGMTTADVLKKCGQPSRKEVEEHLVRSGVQVTGITPLNRWLYDRGSKGKPVVFEFDQDKLISIERLD